MRPDFGRAFSLLAGFAVIVSVSVMIMLAGGGMDGL